MSKKTLLILLAILFVATSSFAQKGNKALGLNLGYGSYNENVTLGAKFNYGLTNKIQLSPSLNYFFKKDDVNGLELNVNAHYLFNIAPHVNLYPLAGLVLVCWDHRYKIGPIFGEKGYNLHNYVTRFGLNLGGGINFRTADSFSIGVEMKYTIIHDVGQFVPMLHLMYHF
jgi:hypothetical protein